MKINIKKWQPYLTRPFDLFGSWLWQGWYESKYMQEALGFKMDEVLFVEISKHLVTQYHTRAQLKLLNKSFRYLLYKKPKRLEKFLQHGVNLTHQADVVLKKRHGGFKNFASALDFFNEVIFFTTVFPYFPSKVLLADEMLPPKINKLCAKLRSTSYYPSLIKKIILPLAPHHFLRELEKKHGSKRFIYQKSKGRETIEWISNPQTIVKQIEGEIKSNQIKGVSTYLGKVSGRVHVILDFMKPGVMKKGQILVSINSNPHLMPLIRKAGALVTDEGGVTNHAAIISRELKIPCVIGTKIATKVLKDGDLVEVDANRGIVKIIKRV